jgi:arylsulfatase A-like enzyme
MGGCDGSTSISKTPIRRIVLISLDTLRPDHLGIYGYARPTSPEIDSFAASSLVFERALAPAPNTPPSQMSMMTSLYPGRHGFTGNGDRLRPGIETLAERLADQGLRTGGFVDGGYLRSEFGFDRGFETYDDDGGGLKSILPRALRWLDERGEEPFFLFLHTYDIHAPYISPSPFAGMFHEEPYTGGLVPTVERLDQLFRRRVKLSAVDMQHLVDSYDEGIRYTDTALGHFFDQLARRGRLEDTLVMITSDHGEEFGEHGSLIHWQLYFQPNLRVPLIVRPPGGLDHPVRIDDQVELVDILPTLLDVSEAAPLEAAQGRSLRPYLDAQDATEPMHDPRNPLGRAAFAWWPDPSQLPIRSLILDNYQLIFDDVGSGGERLFDISVDPMAQKNLAIERPDLVTSLRALGRAGMRAYQGPAPTSGETELELAPELLEELRSLGYER